MENAHASLAHQLQELQLHIKRDASSAKLRIHLFQLLCILGNWQRALGQLQLSAQLDAHALPMAQMYREAIKCEMFRAEVFAGKRNPQVMGTPPPWIGLLIEALRHDGLDDAPHASDLRTQAMEAAVPVVCSVDGVSCEWITDGDCRLGPVCEVFANGQYFWLPFESFSAIRVEAPVDLRDLVWAPAELLLPNEGRVPILIPTRYPETTAAVWENADLLMQSRVTEWLERGPDEWVGLGQRVWMSDVGEHPILDTRDIIMTPPQTMSSVRVTD